MDAFMKKWDVIKFENNPKVHACSLQVKLLKLFLHYPVFHLHGDGSIVITIGLITILKVREVVLDFFHLTYNIVICYTNLFIWYDYYLFLLK